MSFNWFIAKSNCSRAGVKAVGLSTWEREGKTKKGNREKLVKIEDVDRRIASPFGQFISSVQLLTKPSPSCHLTVSNHQMAMCHENRSIKITYISFLFPSLLYF